MADIPDPVRRGEVEDHLRSRFEATISACVDRYLEFSPQAVIPDLHFAEASSECIELYVRGYFLSTVMVTQAVAEGIRNFIAERLHIKRIDGRDGPEFVSFLVGQGHISSESAEAFNRIWKSYRNDIHHMNPPVATIDFAELARRNITDLATIEREIFAVEMNDGKAKALKPQYWNQPRPGESTSTWLRVDPR